MNKLLVCLMATLVTTTASFALDAVFDSMDKAQEVKLAPRLNQHQPQQLKQLKK